MVEARRVVARFKTAEILTKEWVMGIRRTWLKLMSPTIRDWGDVEKAFRQISLYIGRLTDEIFFTRRGPNSGSPTMQKGGEVKKQLDQLTLMVNYASGKAQHWRNVAEDKALPGFNKEDAEGMLNHYRSNFVEATKESMQGRGGKWKNVALTEALDPILKNLREEAAVIQKHDEVNPQDPYEDTSVYKEFDLYGMKVVVDDSTVMAGEIKQYIKYLDEAYQRLKQKGLAKAWYGTVFIKCEKCGGVNQHGAELGVAGHYFIGPDTVRVYDRPGRFIVKLMAHELGHRYWFKQMSQTQRARFESLVKIEGPMPELDPERIISPMDTQYAKKAVDDAWAPLRKLLKDFGGSRIKWWPDMLKRFSEPMSQAGYTAFNDTITAMQKPDVWVSGDAEIKQLHDDAIRVSGEARRTFSDLQSDITSAIHAIPDPTEPIADLDAYWPTVFKPIQKDWIDTATQQLEQAVTAAMIYIDAAVAAHNENESAKNRKRRDEWAEKAERDGRKVEPVSSYGKTNIDEAWAEAFAHYVLGLDMNRDQIDSFKSVLKTARVVERYKLALDLNPQDIERWKKDLRVMTRVYKSIGLEGDAKDVETFEEAKQLFQKFRQNFEQWVYKAVLPKVDKGSEPYLYKDVQKQAWEALYHINSELFPTLWPGGSDLTRRVPNFAELRHSREKNVTRYNKAFNTALKTISDFIENQKDRKRFEDETHNVAGMNVTIPGYGRTENDADLDSMLDRLKRVADPIIRAGFRDAVAGVRLVVDFDPKANESLTNAQYSPSEDRMKVYPLGMIGRGFDGFEGTFVHEMGHRFWFKSMSGQSRAYWDEVMSKNNVKIESQDVREFVKLFGLNEDRDETLRKLERLPLDPFQKAKFREISRFSSYTSKTPDEYLEKLESSMVGDPVLLEGISEYAASGGPIEAFAEVFKAYCLKGPGAVGPMTLNLFKQVVSSGGVRLAASNVVRRYLICLQPPM